MSNSCIILSVRERKATILIRRKTIHTFTQLLKILKIIEEPKKIITNHNFAKNGPSAGGLVSFLIN